MTDHTTHFDDCGCKTARLERRVAELEAALNECCTQCLISSTYDRAVRKVSEVAEPALRGEPTALKALLVRAVNAGTESTDGYSRMYTEAQCEAIAERILGEGR